MHTVQRKIQLIILTAILFPASAWATNGYFTHGVSTKEKGMAGAGVAYSQDTLAAGNNPAGMVLQGERYDVGAALFAPMRSYTVTGAPSMIMGTFGLVPGSFESDNEAFLIPQFGRNWMLDDESSIGLSIYGNGGMNTEYKGANTFFAGAAGVNLAQLFISTTYAQKFSDTASWGVSGIVAYQTFEATGVGSFAQFSLDPANLSNNGKDTSTGLGIRLGVQGEVSPGITLGASYQPIIKMDEFDKYAGLFAERGGFDIPSTLALGIAWHISADRVFLVDVQQINYSDVDSVSNPIAGLQTSCTPNPPAGPATGAGCLGGSSGGGFGWEDITVLKLGYEWNAGNDMTWRVGFSTTDQPIPEAEVLFNILAPGVVEQHYTFGFTKTLDASSSLNFAAMYAPSTSVKGANTFDPPSGQQIELEMDQYELTLSYNRSL